MDLRSIINSDAPAAAFRSPIDAPRREPQTLSKHQRNTSHLTQAHSTSPTAYLRSPVEPAHSPAQHPSPVGEPRLPAVASITSPLAQHQTIHSVQEGLARTSTYPVAASPGRIQGRHVGQNADGFLINHNRPVLHAFTQPISPAYPHPASPSSFNDRHSRAPYHLSQPLTSTTPTSVPTHPYPYRGSPTSTAPQSAHTSHTPHSQPGTPLGPPISYIRTPTNGHKDPSSPFSHHRSQSGTGCVASSPLDHLVRTESDRERSVSVSPKTKVSSRIGSVDMRAVDGRAQAPLGYSVSPTSGRYGYDDRQRLQSIAQRKSSLVALPDQSVALSGPTDYHQRAVPQNYIQLERSQVDGVHHELSQSPEQYSRIQNHSQTLSRRISRNVSPSSDNMEVSTPIVKTQQHQQFTSATSDKIQSGEYEHMSDHSAAQLDAGSKPPSSRPRKSPVDDTADMESAKAGSGLDYSRSLKLQSSTELNDTRTEKEIGPHQPRLRKKSPESAERKQIVPAWAVRARPGQITSMKRSGGQQSHHPSSRAHRHNQTNGHSNDGELGMDDKWQEPSITLDKPYDEVTRELCDFLDAFVVSNDGWRSLEGVKLEIEAKIGMLVDDVTGERLSLPIRTETVLDSNKIQVRFQSYITVEHHKSINAFLNDTFTKSQSASRTPMKYKHTKERDVFYEFHPDTHFAYLPPSAQNIIKPTNHTRIRVTRDDESGADLSKIVKHRVEDLNIYSPGTEFDYRISLNLEFPFHGPSDNLVEAKERGTKKERLKDRMTYWHQDYRIDFTQAKPSEIKTDWTHELEIELDEQRLYHQGKNDRMAYERYVGGLVNNLRVLARSTKDSFVAGAGA